MKLEPSRHSFVNILLAFVFITCILSSFSILPSAPDSYIDALSVLRAVAEGTIAYLHNCRSWSCICLVCYRFTRRNYGVLLYQVVAHSMQFSSIIVSSFIDLFGVVCKSTMHEIFLSYSFFLKRCHTITIFSLCKSAFHCGIFITFIFFVHIHFSISLIPFHFCYWISCNCLLVLFDSIQERNTESRSFQTSVDLKYMCQNKELNGHACAAHRIIFTASVCVCVCVMQ